VFALLTWSAWVLFPLALALAIASSCSAFVLRSRFPEVWDAEGKPVRWLWLTPTTRDGNFFRFLDERRYLATGNAVYALFCAAIRVGWYVLLFTFALVLVGFACALVLQQ